MFFQPLLRNVTDNVTDRYSRLLADFPSVSEFSSFYYFKTLATFSKTHSAKKLENLTTRDQVIAKTDSDVAHGATIDRVKYENIYIRENQLVENQ